MNGHSEQVKISGVKTYFSEKVVKMSEALDTYRTESRPTKLLHVSLC
jgi:hypothetical protein